MLLSSFLIKKLVGSFYQVLTLKISKNLKIPHKLRSNLKLNNDIPLLGCQKPVILQKNPNVLIPFKQQEVTLLNDCKLKLIK